MISPPYLLLSCNAAFGLLFICLKLEDGFAIMSLTSGVYLKILMNFDTFVSAWKRLSCAGAFPLV